MRSTPPASVIVSILAVAAPAAAGPAFTWDGAIGADAKATEVSIASRIDVVCLGLGFGALWRDTPAEERRIDNLEVHLWLGNWVERGRWNFLAAGDIGAIDRFTIDQTWNMDSNWTASAGVRGFAALRFLRVPAAHGTTASFALALGTRAYVTADREAVGLLTLALVGWRSDEIE